MTAIEDAAEGLNRLWPRNLSLAFANAIRKYMNAAEAEIQRLTTPPTDDEREALALILRGEVEGGMPWEMVADAYRGSADRAIAAGFHRQGPITDVWERRTENRIHYRYGVNSGTYSAWPHGVTASHDEQQRRLESETSGPVDVTLRESRTVVYGPWEPVETDAD